MEVERKRGRNVEALQMENDLLSYENRYLRARIAEGDHEVPATAPARRTAGDDRYQRAYYDLRWLLQRVRSTPAARVVRLWPGWRTLEERYLS